MGDDSSGALEGKSLSNLRVVDLKLELEKRGLSKSGSKKELVKRLKQKLELEKLYEESSAIGDAEPKLQLDEATEQNEFVKKYLAEQQKIYARQKEVKRLIELREMGKLDEDETDSDATNKDQDSDVSESLNTTRNSCDSSTHAESAEPEHKDENLSSASVSSAEDPEPSSTVEDDASEHKEAASSCQDNRHSESLNSNSAMESLNPESVAYSLADIQLPDKTGRTLKIKLSECKVSCSPESTVQVPNSEIKEDSQKDESTNGTSEEREDIPDSVRQAVNNMSEKLEDVSVAATEEKVPVAEPKEPEPRQASEPMEEESETIPAIDDSDKLEAAVQEDQDKSEKDNSNNEVEKMDVSEVSISKPKEIPEESVSKSEESSGENTDSESEDKDVKNEQPPQEDSRDSSESSSSESNKRSRSSSSDSSSSQESIPKRKPYNRPCKPSGSPEYSKGNSDQIAVKEETKKETPQPRRIKIKRTTTIVTPEKEVKVEQPKPKHEKIEMEKVESCIPPKPKVEKITVEPKVPIVESPTIKKPEVVEPPIVETKPVTVTYRKLNVPFKKSEESKNKSEKKRPWHCAALTKTSVSISTDSLKSIIPDFKVVCSPSVLSEPEEIVTKSLEPNISPSKSTQLAKKAKLVVEEVQEKEDDISPSIKKARRDSLKVVPPLEPMEVDRMLKTNVPEKPQSCILFIQNLVRPFTLLQLKEVLKQTGTLVEDGFWIDKIKSKCFVTYETEEQALKTREALHNCRWPASNPKILSVQFSTQEEFNSYKSDAVKPASLPQPLTSSLPQVPEHKDSSLPISGLPKKREREESPKERERHRQAAIYIREWDKDKLTQESPDKEQGKDERRRSPPRRRDRSRSTEKRDRKKGRDKTSREAAHSEKKDVHKKTPEEETPAKLLDDLFQKTKATPCIYWLPLTEEQMKQKEDQRRVRRLEREKRNQEQEEAERQARRKPRAKESRSRTRSPVRRR